MNLVGKGWVVLAGVLAVALLFFIFRGLQLGNEVKSLQSQFSTIKQQAPTPEPTDSASPSSEQAPTEGTSPTAAPTPDLKTAAGRDAARKADLQKIASALTKYRTAQGGYPPDLKTLIPNYLEHALTDPLAPKYTYRYQRTKTGFKLTCILESKNDPDDAKDSDGKRDQVYTLTEQSQ